MLRSSLAVLAMALALSSCDIPPVATDEPADASDASLKDAPAEVAEASEASEENPWTPAKLPGLRLWLDASAPSHFELDQSKVSKWSDLSLAQNHCLQLKSTWKPIWNSEKVTFSATAQQHLNGPAGQDLVDVTDQHLNLWLVTAIPKTVAVGTGNLFTIHAGAGLPALQVRSDYETASFVAAALDGSTKLSAEVSTGSLAKDKVHILRVRKAAAKISIFVGGVQKLPDATTARPSLLVATDSLKLASLIGASFTSSQQPIGPFSGDLYEVIFVRGLLDEEVAVQVDDYLNARWASK